MSNYRFRLGETDDGSSVMLDLPTLIETRLFDLASSGGGKSYALRVLIEKTAGHVQWIVIDPEGEFSSLREKFDFLLVGRDGELPVDVHSAKLLARKIMETRVSTIIDLYEFKDARKPWLADFLTELMTLPKNLWSPVMVAIDEAHQFAPESVKGKENEPPARARRAVITLSDSGRKQSRGCVIATQRLSKLAADARAELRNNLIGLTVQDLDRDRAADILGIPKRESAMLRELQAGEFFAFGPAFVSQRGVFRMKIDAALTRHPKPGEGRLLAVPKASDAIKTVVAELGDLPAQAQAEIHALDAAQREVITLRQTNQRLQTELHHAKTHAPARTSAAPETKIERVEIPMLRAGEAEQLSQITQHAAQVALELQAAIAQMSGVAQTVKQAIDTAALASKRAQVILPPPARVSAPIPLRVARTAAPADSAVFGAGEQKVLRAIAQYADGMTRDTLTVLTGYKRSSRDTYIQRLQARGLVSVERDRVSATEQGIAALGPDFELLPTGAALQAYWLARLTGGEKEILKAALDTYPQWLDRDVVSELTNYKRSSRDTYIQRLTAWRLLDTKPSAIRASDTLFQE